MPPDLWWLYMLECRGGKIYIGIAKDVQARFHEHVAGHGALFTKLNPPLRIAASIQVGSYAEARRKEREMQRLSRLEKIQWMIALSGGIKPTEN